MRDWSSDVCDSDLACARSWLVQWRYGPCEDSDMWSRRHLMSPAPKSASIRGHLLLHMALLFSVGLAALYCAASTYATYAADSSFDRFLIGSASSLADIGRAAGGGSVWPYLE